MFQCSAHCLAHALMPRAHSLGQSSYVFIVVATTQGCVCVCGLQHSTNHPFVMWDFPQLCQQFGEGTGVLIIQTIFEVLCFFLNQFSCFGRSAFYIHLAEMRPYPQEEMEIDFRILWFNVFGSMSDNKLFGSSRSPWRNLTSMKQAVVF